MCKLFQKLIIGGVAIKLGVGGEGCGWKIFQKLIIGGGGVGRLFDTLQWLHACPRLFQFLHPFHLVHAVYTRDMFY